MSNENAQQRAIYQVINPQPLTTAPLSTIDTNQIYSLTTSQLTSLNITGSTIGASTSPFQGQLNLNSIHSVINQQYDLEHQNIGIKTTKYIIAGNYSEYKNFIKRKKFDENYYKFVNNADTLRGLRNIHGYYVGSWKNRTDIEDLKLAIEIANL